MNDESIDDDDDDDDSMIFFLRLLIGLFESFPTERLDNEIVVLGNFPGFQRNIYH
jgi:hypothetical protein